MCHWLVYEYCYLNVYTIDTRYGYLYVIALILFFSQLKCCGLDSFTDYENLFDNLSVPLSCCNITHPLVNQSACPEIVTNATLANLTSQIYTEVVFVSLASLTFLSLIIHFDFSSPSSYSGCVSHLESFYQYIYHVVGQYYIIWGILLVCQFNKYISLDFIDIKPTWANI